jgi:hypothetical protein
MAHITSEYTGRRVRIDCIRCYGSLASIKLSRFFSKPPIFSDYEISMFLLLSQQNISLKKGFRAVL